MAVIHVDSNTFKSEVLDFSGTALVDFGADWCGPCQMLSPIIDEIANDPANTAKIVKVDVDKSSDIAAQYNVSSLPTVIVFKNGSPIKTISGFHQKQEYLTEVQ